MRISIARSLSSAVAIVAVVGCASTPQYESGTAAGSVDLSAYPAPPLEAAEAQALRGMSDADIFGHIASVDSIEIAAANDVLRRTTTGAVVDYARMMRDAHSASLEHGRALARDVGITPADIGEFKMSGLYASLDSIRTAPQAMVDRRYVLSQIMLHRHVLTELETLQGVAQNAMLREHLAATIPVVRDHLARAHAIAITMDFEKKHGN